MISEAFLRTQTQKFTLKYAFLFYQRGEGEIGIYHKKHINDLSINFLSPFPRSSETASQNVPAAFFYQPFHHNAVSTFRLNHHCGICDIKRQLRCSEFAKDGYKFQVQLFLALSSALPSDIFFMLNNQCYMSSCVTEHAQYILQL